MIGSTIKISKPKKETNKIIIPTIISNPKPEHLNYQFNVGKSDVLIFHNKKELLFPILNKVQTLKVTGTENLKITFFINSEIYGTTLILANDYIKIMKYENRVLGLRTYLTFFPTQIIKEYECKNHDLIHDSILFISSENLVLNDKTFILQKFKYVGHNHNKILLRCKTKLLLLNFDLQIIGEKDFENTRFQVNSHYLINSNFEIYNFNFERIKLLSDKGTIYVSNNIYIAEDNILKVYTPNFDTYTLKISNIIYVSENTIFYENDGIKYKRSENWDLEYTLGTFKDYHFVANFNCSTLLIAEAKKVKIYRLVGNSYAKMDTLSFPGDVIKVKLNDLGNTATIQTSDKLYFLK